MFVPYIFVLISFAYGFNPQHHKSYYVNNQNMNDYNKINMNDYNKINKNDALPEYEIPNWVYKKVFKYNKPTTYIKEKDYTHLFRTSILPETNK